MGYTVNVFHAAVRREAEGGKELDSFEHPALEPKDMERLIKRLKLYGYKQIGDDKSSRGANAPNEYQKTVGTCPITLAVFRTQLSFSIPFWEGSQDAIYEALQDSSELADSETLAVHNPQLNAWNDG